MSLQAGGAEGEEERIPSRLHAEREAPHRAQSHKPQMVTEPKPRVRNPTDCATQEPLENQF